MKPALLLLNILSDSPADVVQLQPCIVQNRSEGTRFLRGIKTPLCLEENGWRNNNSASNPLLHVSTSAGWCSPDR